MGEPTLLLCVSLRDPPQNTVQPPILCWNRELLAALLMGELGSGDAGKELSLPGEGVYS